MELADRVLAGLEALRAGRPGSAVGWLRPVADDAALHDAEDLRDVRARVCSLLAQALLETGELRDAERYAAQAASLASEVGDDAGVKAIRELRTRIMGEAVRRHKEGDVSSEAARIASRRIESLLDGVAPGLPTAEVLLAKANAEIDVGRPYEGVAFARRALVIARAEDGLRVQVLAHLTIARATPDQAAPELEEALRLADTAGDTTLVTAVVRAADLAGVALAPVPIGGRS